MPISGASAWEKLEPEAVVEMLNHFFTAIVVFEHEGTLDKFIGDI